MGTDFRITVILPAEREPQPLLDLLTNRLQQIEQRMSTYIDDSEVSRFNRAAAGQPVTLSDDTANVVRQAQDIAKLSGGYFDITVAALVNAWGFGPDGAITVRPEAELLEGLRASVGYSHLKLDGDQLSKTIDGVTIDLSAIAKGYAVDELSKLLAQQRVTDYLIDIGGELKARGVNIDRQLWRVGIERPEMLGGIAKVVELDSLAIATSGDYRNFLEIDGERFSHTIDPLTASPVLHRLALVSVLAEQASEADALATALLAMGEDKARRFAKQHELSVYLVIRQANTDSYEEFMTPGFAQRIQSHGIQ
ncbi:MAG: FAD:protein FMN transferase [Gammaproteobacteria bacterium]|nr:FAD:protein FMN transferase [Gammaproteobacteria bacterium]